MAEEEKQYTKAQLKKILNEKQRMFCHEYIVDWNGSRSYKKAYQDIADDTARSNAYRLLTNAHIKQYIELIKNDFEIEAGISKLRNLKELAKIAYSSISHMHDTWIERKDFEKIPEDEKDAIESIDTKILKKNIGPQEEPEIVDVEFIKIKLFPKIPAIKEINETMGYKAAEKHDHSGSITNINVTPTKEEAKSISEALEDDC